MKDIMETEGSPCEVGPAVAASEASGEHQELDHFTDDEPETELVALQHLPPEERRKALRRLRNRESARRVRARRLAEMSQMGSTLQSLQDENAALKSHVSKLQSHVQSMTLKVYEVTAKYESAVAESAQLRTELLRFRRPSAPGDSSFVAPAGSGATAAAAAANGPSSAQLNQLSPFIAPMELAGGTVQQTLSPGHVQLRSSSPRDLLQQRQALEEVVMLLKEHKRRNQDRSGGSEIGSCGAGGNNATSAHSPTSDTPLMAAAPPLGGFAASALGTNNSSNNGMPYNVGDVSRFMGGEGTGASGLGSGRGCQSEILMGSQQAQAHLQAAHRWGLDEGTGMGSGKQQVAMCSLLQPNAHHRSVPHRNSTNNASSSVGGQMQPQPITQAQPLPHPLLGNPGPPASLSLPLPSQQQQMQLQQQVQQQQALGQSHSHPIAQLQLPYHQQVQLPYHQQVSLLDQQQQMQGMGSGVLYGSMSPLSLSAPFYSAMSVLPGGGAAGGGGLQMPVGHNSGPTALGSGICGLGNMAAAAAARGMGTGGHSSQHRSASYALDRGTVATSAQNVVAMHPTWQANVGNGAAGVAMLTPEDISEDMLMSLDDYVPQDL